MNLFLEKKKKKKDRIALNSAQLNISSSIENLKLVPTIKDSIPEQLYHPVASFAPLIFPRLTLGLLDAIIFYCENVIKNKYEKFIKIMVVREGYIWDTIFLVHIIHFFMI